MNHLNPQGNHSVHSLFLLQYLAPCSPSVTDWCLCPAWTPTVIPALFKLSASPLLFPAVCATQVTETELLNSKGGSTEAERDSPSGGKDNLWKDRPFATDISASSPILKGDSDGDKERHS